MLTLTVISVQREHIVDISDFESRNFCYLRRFSFDLLQLQIKRQVSFPIWPLLDILSFQGDVSEWIFIHKLILGLK